MGRHRKYATDKNNVRKPSSFGYDEEPSETVQDRLGMNGTVCVECNARNPKDADDCRKCNGDVRRKASEFRNE